MANETYNAVLNQGGTLLTIKDVGSLPEALTAMIPTAYVSTPAYADPLALSITQPIEIVEPGDLTGNVTINLTISSELSAGAELFIRCEATGVTATVTFGTGITTATAFTVATTKITWIHLVYNATAYQVIEVYQTN